MRREICGDCSAPVNDDGTCDCTELLKRGWRLCAVGQKTTQWCAEAERVRGELREQRQRDEALLRQVLEALEELQYAVVSTAKTDDVSLYYRAIVALRERLGLTSSPD